MLRAKPLEVVAAVEAIASALEGRVNDGIAILSYKNVRSSTNDAC